MVRIPVMITFMIMSHVIIINLTQLINNKSNLENINSRYLQSRMPVIRSKLLIPTVQSLLILWALFCSVSRITDNRHHWWDVLAGALFGILVASATVNISIENIELFWNDIDSQKNLLNSHRKHSLTLVSSSSIPFQCIFLCKRFEGKRVTAEIIHQNGNGDRHTSVRRLLSERTKDEVTLNHVVVP